MIARKTENPRPDKRISHSPCYKIIVQKNEPINSAEPQGRACGPAVLGHKEYGPVLGIAAHGPFPPAQFLKPDAINLTPTSITVGPVTSGGKIFLRSLGGIKERAISKSAQTHPVPRIAPG